MSDPVAALAAWLTKAHCDQKKLESDARFALYEKKDEVAYRQLMRERAERLADLEDESKDALNGVSESLYTEVSAALNRFSRGAQNALELDSVFYMSALLYPDDYQAGQPDNLERLIARLIP